MHTTGSGDRFRTLQLSAFVVLIAVGVALSGAAVVAGPASIHTAPPAEPLTAQTGTTWVIYVDDLHLDFHNTGRLRDLLRRIAGELFHDGDTFGMFSSGPSSLAIDVTSDRQRIEAAIKRATGNGLRLPDILSAPDGREVGYRASLALTTATDVLENLEKLPGRKALVYVSNGYDFDTLPEHVAASGSAPGPGPVRAVTAAQAHDQLAALPQLALRAGVTIFAIDPRTLYGDPLLDPDVDSAVWQRHLDMTRETLRQIAEGAGGFAVVDKVDLAATLKRISSAMHD